MSDLNHIRHISAFKKKNKWAYMNLYALYGLFLSFCMPPFYSAHAQTNFSIGVSTGLEAGWWVYTYPSDPTDFSSSLAWDRTHLAIIFPYALHADLHLNKWSFGITAGRSYLDDDEMVTQDDQRGARRRVPIANNGQGVPIRQLGIKVGRVIVDQSGYQLVPTAWVHTFSLTSIHPDQPNFGFRYGWKVSFENWFNTRKNLQWMVSPQYSRLSIFPKNASQNPTRHLVIGIGLGVGVRVLWGK